MVLHHLQPSWSGGEISPSLYARVDAADYTTCLQTAENMFIHAQGGVSNRPGTILQGTSKTGGSCRLFSFVIGENESYVVEAGSHYLRFFSSGGRVLTAQGSIYECETPYQEDEIPQLNYTQHNHILYFTHPHHPPYRLIRKEAGVFTFEPVPLAYGPFQLSNNDPTHHLRIYQTQDSVVTDGVRATLSLQPVSYPQYVMWAFFNNEWFYAAANYGLDVAQIVTAFNQHYASQGFTAYNLGGVIKITSPASTGGDWNGTEFKLAYMDRLDEDPVLTVTQALSGGYNQGEEIAQGELRYELASDWDYFTPSHVGGLFLLQHTVDAQYASGVLGYETNSSSIQTGSAWTLRTSGVWTGQLIVEVSKDLGTSWKTVKVLSRQEGDENFTVPGDLNDDENLYYVRVRSNQITGEAGYELQADCFVQEAIVKVTQFVNTRKLVVEVERAFASEDWTEKWSEGSFSPLAGYPRCVFFFQDRLGFAGTNAEPQTLWFSKTAAYTDFGHARFSLKDTDAISINLSGKKLNEIRSVLVANRLLIFTAGSEWTLTSNGAFTPYNMQLEQQSEYGSSTAAPLMTGNKALFVSAHGSAVRNFYYDYNSASYASADVTLRARHLFFNHTITEIAFQQEPDHLVWCVRKDGVLLSLTYVPEQGICAWAHHTTQGKFRSICAVSQDGQDALWCVVERAGVYYIEMFAKRLESRRPQDQIFMDATTSVRKETAFNKIENLNYLEGKEVCVLADGNFVRGLRVQQGKLLLPQPSSCVHVGLGYSAILQTLPASFYRSNGTILDQKKRIVAVTVKLIDSRGGSIGSFDGNQTYWERLNLQNLIEPIPLQTRDVHCVLGGRHEYFPSVIFKQEEPFPVTLLACISRIV